MTRKVNSTLKKVQQTLNFDESKELTNSKASPNSNSNQLNQKEEKGTPPINNFSSDPNNSHSKDKSNDKSKDSPVESDVEEDIEIEGEEEQKGQTKKKQSSILHIDDTSEGDNSWDIESSEEEDDVNTVSSDQTSTIKKKDQGKVVLPKFTRYQIMILLDQDNSNAPIAEENGEEKSPPDRIRDFLVSFYAQMKIYDPKSKIMTWKMSPNFSYMDDDQFPTEPAEIATFFQGFRANLKADKRVYLRVALHTPESESKLYALLHSYMQLYGYSFNKCIIQAESSTCIGWLNYSSQYTDTELLKSILIKRSGFEWGFRLISVTQEDHEEAWMKRLKAVGIYVPSPVRDIALSIIGEMFDSTINNEYAGITDNYLFVESEKSTKGSKSKKDYYAQMVDRQSTHTESLQADISYGIAVDLDKEHEVNDEGRIHDTTLRSIILDMQVNDPDSELKGDPLFHSVDYIEDNSKLWLDGEKCPGGSCVIFTFYKQVANEATTMIKGLGRLIKKFFGTNIAAEMFTLYHFKANKGYQWNVNTGLFITPQDKQRKNNQRKDKKMETINKLKRLQEEEKAKAKLKEEENKSKSMLINEATSVNDKDHDNKEQGKTTRNSKKKKKSKKKNKRAASTPPSAPSPESPKDKSPADESPKNPPSPDKDPPTTHPSPDPKEEQRNPVDSIGDTASNVTEQIRDAKLKSILKKKDPDMDSVENTSQTRERPSNININSNGSVASSLTNISIGSQGTSMSDLLSKESDSSKTTVAGSNKSSSKSSNSTRKSKYEMTSKMISTIDNGSEADLSSTELRRRVKAYQEMKILEAKQIAEAEVEKYLVKRTKKATKKNPETEDKPSNSPPKVQKAPESNVTESKDTNVNKSSKKKETEGEKGFSTPTKPPSSQAPNNQLKPPLNPSNPLPPDIEAGNKSIVTPNNENQKPSYSQVAQTPPKTKHPTTAEKKDSSPPKSEPKKTHKKVVTIKEPPVTDVRKSTRLKSNETQKTPTQAGRVVTGRKK